MNNTFNNYMQTDKKDTHVSENVDNIPSISDGSLLSDSSPITMNSLESIMSSCYYSNNNGNDEDDNVEKENSVEDKKQIIQINKNKIEDNSNYN